ncbi:hypothetical protein [Brucella sp. NBRC 12950]|uniref:hypothetical protein n=1 Tax=Brucella sp. NBRC 12950 TaxID=2994518 RepID=UPI0024A0ABE4|nr:hypothetical protein [Brucella sp. NBRC 12950]GLU27963.1 hypothetical protein Brsp01_31960 [Brucella sp. NBRC 12950]
MPTTPFSKLGERDERNQGTEISGGATSSATMNISSKKRTLYDFFSPERNAKAETGKSRQDPPAKKLKTSKARGVTAVNTLAMASDVLIPVNYNDIEETGTVKLVTRHKYQRDEGISFTKDELPFIGCLKKNVATKRYEICTSDKALVKELKNRKIIFREDADTYKAVKAEAYFKDKDLRTLAQAQKKFGKTGIFLLQGEHYINAADFPPQQADREFAKCCGNIYEVRQSGFPEALYKLPDGNYGSAARLARVAAANGSEPSTMEAERQRSVLILSNYDKSYYCPSTLELTSRHDSGYYTNKISSLALPEDIADCPRYKAPLVLAKDPFEDDLFHSSENIMKMSEDECRHRFGKDSIIVQNRNGSGKFTGNFAIFAKYERGERTANDAQAQVFRRMGFNNFNADEVAREQVQIKSSPQTSNDGISSKNPDPRSELKSGRPFNYGR